MATEAEGSAVSVLEALAEGATPSPTMPPGELCLGELVDHGADGRLRISYRAAGRDWQAWAQVLGPLPPGRERALVIGFLQGDPAQPLVLGALAGPLDAVLAATAPPEAQAIPKRVTICAQESIELVCGEARIKLSACGRTLVEGRAVTSRAATTNRLLGATVAIN